MMKARFYGKGAEGCTRWKQAVSVIILLCVFVGMIFEDRTGIPSYMVAIMGAVADVLLGFLRRSRHISLSASRP